MVSLIAKLARILLAFSAPDQSSPVSLFVIVPIVCKHCIFFKPFDGLKKTERLTRSVLENLVKSLV